MFKCFFEDTEMLIPVYLMVALKLCSLENKKKPSQQMLRRFFNRAKSNFNYIQLIKSKMNRVIS